MSNFTVEIKTAEKIFFHISDNGKDDTPSELSLEKAEMFFISGYEHQKDEDLEEGDSTLTLNLTFEDDLYAVVKNVKTGNDGYFTHVLSAEGTADLILHGIVYGIRSWLNTLHSNEKDNNDVT